MNIPLVLALRLMAKGLMASFLHSQQNRVGSRFFVFGILGVLFVSFGGCSWRAPQPALPTVKSVEGGMSLSQVVLTRTDDQGNLLWKFQAQGLTYGDRQQVAMAKTLKGQLYQGGKPIFDIQANQGTVRQTNQQVKLQGKIQILDRQHQVRFRGKEAQWNPQAGILTVRDGLSANNSQLQVWANELQASQRGREVQIKGNVVMETRSPNQNKQRRIRLKADQAIWSLDRQSLKVGSVLSNDQQPTVQIERMDGGDEKAIAIAGQAIANLKTGIVALESPVRLSIGTLTLTSRALNWDTQSQRVFSPTLLNIQDSQRQVSVVANQGSLEQARNLLDLQGKVEVTGLRDRARLESDQLLWNTQNQRIEARGNVNYVQESPAFTLRGPKALGRLEEQTIRISGGEVVTEILP